MLTVGASTLDKKIPTMVKLGNGAVYYGQSVHQPKGYPSPSLPLVFPGDKSSDAAVCAPGSLDGIDLKGKVVVCDVGGVGRVQKGTIVKEAGGAAMILANTKAGRLSL